VLLQRRLYIKETERRVGHRRRHHAMMPLQSGSKKKDAILS
jgi:hypothetical protein